MTHEEFVTAIADVAAGKLGSAEQEKVRAIKLCYGAGPDGTRGVTYFNRWKTGPEAAMPFVAINAIHQESIVQLAGTTLHELGHVLAGWEAGHRKDWSDACSRLGLRCVKAAGTAYTWAHFAPDIRHAIACLPRPVDGNPLPLAALALPGGRTPAIKPCSAGQGTKGGRSRGTGSGSRLRLFECECEPPIKVRVARDEFDCTCNTCSTVFLKR